MANATRGEHAVRLADGRALTLCFDVNAFCEVEDRLGVNINAIGAVLATPTVRQIRTLFHCALMARHPEITEREAGALLPLAEMVAAVGDAMRAASPEATGDASPNGAAAGRTGSPSSPTTPPRATSRKASGA